jgi:hypothetical protein
MMAQDNVTLPTVSGVRMPDSKLVREVTEFIRDAESDLLFHYSVRVYFWGALTGDRKGLRFDSELFYAAAMFHDIGLTPHYGCSKCRFEVDGANVARDFLRQRGISESDAELVWNAVALHTTPGIPEFMRPEIALVQAGAGMDVAGRGYDAFTDAEREAVVTAFPREADFKHGIIDAFYEGMKHRSDTTFGTFDDDVLAFKDPHFRRIDLCSVILASSWSG